MELQVENLGKRFGFEWIFQKLNHHFTSQKSYAITGPNGSGKSTLLQILSGSSLPSRGSVSYHHKAQSISVDQVFRHLSIAAPYADLVEEFTLKELLYFHFSFKDFLDGWTHERLVECLYLEKSYQKELRYYSSGMKQRVKLGLALFTDSPLVFLDEPLTNLDQQGIDWYKDLVQKYRKDRLVIIASNRVEAYDFCEEVVDMGAFKGE